jgi:glycosyltransferase involved in cell wall biosynthesis
MHFHGLKKRLAWLLYQRRDLQSARVLHATSRQEAEEFRALGLKQPIAVIPNGVSLPPQSPNCESSKRKFEIENQKSEIRTILFLSRIHPKKGLLDLVEAWAAVNRQSAIGNRQSTSVLARRVQSGKGRRHVSGFARLGQGRFVGQRSLPGSLLEHWPVANRLCARLLAAGG